MFPYQIYVTFSDESPVIVGTTQEQLPGNANLENVTAVLCLDLLKPGDDLLRLGVRLALQRSVTGPVTMQDYADRLRRRVYWPSRMATNPTSVRE